MPTQEATLPIGEYSQELLSSLSDEDRSKATGILQSIENGASIGDLSQIDHEKLDAVYGVARVHYQNHEFETAVDLFRFLTLMDYTNTTYWLGLGSTYQMQKDFEKAVEAYAMATLLDIDDVQPQLQAAYCLNQLQKYSEATCALEGVLLTSDLDPTARLQAEAMLGKIEAETASAE